MFQKIVIGQLSAARLTLLNPRSIKFQKMFNIKNAFSLRIIGPLVSSYVALPSRYMFFTQCYHCHSYSPIKRRSIWQFKICFFVIPHFLRGVRQLLAQKHFTYCHGVFFQLALYVQHCPERCFFSSFCTKRAPPLPSLPIFKVTDI